MKIYTVGGCVRDRLLGVAPKDIDYVVVGATPDDMLKQGFEQVGADFPVFLHPETKDEYALARIERKTGNGYHGFAVDASVSITLEEDLGRRDLTINSMAMDDDGNVYDPFNGQVDLKNKVLRHTTDAFSEDPLRVIRLARFYARYSDFTVCPDTVELCKALVQNGELNHLSVERFWAELEKVIKEPHFAKFFEFLFEVGANDHVDFFSNLFNGAPKDEVLNIVHQQNRRYTIPGGNRLMSIAAQVTKGDGKTIKTAVKEIQSAANNYGKFLTTDFTDAEAVLDLIVKAGAFRQGTTYEDLVNVLFDAAQTFEGDASKAFNKRKMVFISASIKASTVNVEELVDKFQGKALGDAIRAARLKKVEEQIKRIF